MRAHWRQRLALNDAQADELMADYWRWYVGTLDQELFDWFAAQRPGPQDRDPLQLRARSTRGRALLGLRGDHRRHRLLARGGPPQARPADLLARPRTRLDVRPDEIVFLDDVEGHVEAARAVGYRGVVHRSTPESIAEIEAVIEAERRR